MADQALPNLMGNHVLLLHVRPSIAARREMGNYAYYCWCRSGDNCRHHFLFGRLVNVEDGTLLPGFDASVPRFW